MKPIDLSAWMPSTPLRQIDKDDGLPQNEVEDCRLDHCLLEDKHLKEVKFLGGAIIHSRFVNCKLTNARFERVDLTGTKFIGCDLKDATFQNCQTWFTRFEHCELDYAQLIATAPREPNLRRMFLKELRVNATQRCERKWVDKLLNLELRTREHELLDTVFGRTQYCRNKYSGWQRLKAGLELIAQGLNRYWWGYGLKLSNLVRSGVVVLAFFAALHHSPPARYAVSPEDRTAVRLSWTESGYYSVISFTTGGAGDIKPANAVGRILTSTEALCGVLFLGFFAAAMYRRLSE